MSVFHKPAAELYIPPYSSEHPRHIHCSTIKGALFRAERLCYNVQDFENERLHIELTLLLNGYPTKFIAYHFKRFFEQHHAVWTLQSLDDVGYQLLHKKLLAQLSRREKQKNVISKKQQDKPEDWNKEQITVHFTFESDSMLQFKPKLRRLWRIIISTKVLE